MADDVRVWAAGVELVMEELSGGDLLPGRIFLCGGGSRLPEIEAVMGHEMGHYVLHHNYKGVAFLGLITFLGFVFLNLSFGGAVRRFGTKWGVRGLSKTARLADAHVLVTDDGLSSDAQTTLAEHIDRIIVAPGQRRERRSGATSDLRDAS